MGYQIRSTKIHRSPINNLIGLRTWPGQDERIMTDPMTSAVHAWLPKISFAIPDRLCDPPLKKGTLW
jgi:hypothetical protein